jgi:hypothetical protein
MSQICTNKEQSSRLLEAGVRPETADMSYHFTRSRVPTLEWELQTKPPTLRGKFWTPQRIAKLAMPFNKHPDGTHMTGEEVFDNLWGKDVPAWSLSKLIDMLPATISQRNRPDLSLEITKDSVYWFIQYTELGYDCKHEVMKKNVLDAVVNMIEWLIKEGYLDKKYLTDKCGDCRLIEDEDANGDAWCAFHQKPVRCDSRACEDILKKGGSNA